MCPDENIRANDVIHVDDTAMERVCMFIVLICFCGMTAFDVCPTKPFQNKFCSIRSRSCRLVLLETNKQGI